VGFFSRKYRVVCPDYPGYGRSDRLDRFPSGYWMMNARLAAAMLRDLAGAMPLSRLVLYARGGHPLMWTRKREHRREVMQFLELLP
jgi:pimeloyl-ACP methyl ester carboxylesterase